MATAANSISHIHQHEKKLSPDSVALEKTKGGVWIHEHYHSHNLRQGYSQTYTYDHKHAHAHDADVPRHALTDMKPDEKATVRSLCGRPSFGRRFSDIQLSAGVIVANVAPKAETQEWELTINGQLQTITADEAAAVIVEVQ